MSGFFYWWLDLNAVLLWRVQSDLLDIKNLLG